MPEPTPELESTCGESQKKFKNEINDELFSNDLVV
jgi:hypothetical protein